MVKLRFIIFLSVIFIATAVFSAELRFKSSTPNERADVSLGRQYAYCFIWNN